VIYVRPGQPSQGTTSPGTALHPGGRARLLQLT
jgi:hypothetical protein